MTAERPCATCRQPIIRAWISSETERDFDASPIEGGEWGLWTHSNRLSVIRRARLHTPENHFGTGGHALHVCPGAAGEQLELAAS